MNRNGFMTLLVWLVLVLPTHGAASQPFILIDASSGEILAEKDANHRWYPASLTKLMTAYVTFRAVQNGELENGSPVTISHNAIRQPPSRMGYKKGIQLRVDTALKIIIVKSANDVSIALAEAVAGTVEDFVERMNFESQRLGLTNTRFANPNGLHNTGQFSSARDMSLLSMTILKEFPQYAPLFSSIAIRTPTKTHYSYNLLLQHFAGTTGMKTGFVCAAGFNLVASATRNGRSLIAVLLGTSSQGDRAVSAAKLLSEGFSEKYKGNGSVFAQPSSTASAAPVNMRPILCTEKARAARYDPAGGKAVIKSTYLQAEKIAGDVLPIKIGGIDAGPSDAFMSAAFVLKGKLPVPVKSPGYASVRLAGIAEQTAEQGSGYIPVPTPRPR